MARGSGGNSGVSLGVSIEGVSDAVAALNLLENAMDRLTQSNGSSGSSLGTGMPLNSGGSLYTPVGSIPGSGVLQSGNLSNYPMGGTALPPGALAPNPLSGAPAPHFGNTGYGGMNGSNTGTQIVVNGGTVNYYGGSGGGMTPNTTPSGMPYYGTGIGGGGGGGYGGRAESIVAELVNDSLARMTGASSGGGSGPGGGGLSPTGYGGSFDSNGRFLAAGQGGQLARINPNVTRLQGRLIPQAEATEAAGFDFLPIAAAAAGAFGYIASRVGDSAYLGQRPQFENQLGFDVAARRGQWVNPAMDAGQSVAADIRGANAGRRSNLWWGTLTSLPFIGGAVGRYYDLVHGQDAERSAAEAEATGYQDASRLRLGAMAGRNFRGGDDPFLSNRDNLGNDFGAYGSGGITSLMGTNFGRLTRGGRTAGDAETATRILAQFGLQPQYSGLTDMVSRGGDVSGIVPTAVKSFIAGGDRQSIAALQRGGYLSAGEADADIKKAGHVARMLVHQQIDQIGIGTQQAGLRLQTATGAGLYQQASGMESIARSYSPIISIDRQRLALEPDPIKRAQLQQQIETERAIVEESRTQAIRMRFSSDQTFAGVGIGRAQASRQAAVFTGSESDVLNTFGAEATSSRSMANIYRRMSHESRFSPEERAQYGLQALQAENNVRFGLPREQGAFQLGLRNSEIGVGASRYSAALTNASLYGSASDVYGAQVNSTNTLRSQLQINSQELSGAFGARTQQERLDLQQRQIELTRQLNETLEQSKRSFASANLSVAQFGQSMASSRSGIQLSYFGVGGGAAASLQSGNVSAARSTLAVAQSNFDAVKSLPASNPYRQQREQELVQAQAGAQGALQDYASLPFSVGLDREANAARFSADVIGRTYAPWGDVRGTYSTLLRNVGARGKELQQYKSSALADLYSDHTLTPEQRENRRAVLMRDIEQRQYGLGEEAIGYQTQLENGWQDRLVSSVVNMPSNGAFVASQFTRKEAAPFLQSMSSVFGFSGAGAGAERDRFLFRGPQFANTNIGNISRPEGFMATAMAMGGGGGAGLHQMPASATLTPSQHSGAGAGNQAQVRAATEQLVAAIVASIMANLTGGSNPLGQGRSSTAIHDITNNQALINPAYPAGMSRQ